MSLWAEVHRPVALRRTPLPERSPPGYGCDHQVATTLQGRTRITLGSRERDEQRHLTEVLRCPGAGGGRLPAWRTERACEPLTAEHEKGDTDMKGWAEPEHLHAQPGSQTAWVGEVA